MHLILYFIIEYYTVILIVLAFYILVYLNFQRRMRSYVSLINKNLKDNAHLYTPEVRAYIQKIVQECGVTASVAPITGFRAGNKDEPLAFAILPSQDQTFYINIPFAWISFLREVQQKIHAHEQPSAAESGKLNAFIWIMHHEMNHVKKMAARKSVFTRSYPWKTIFLSMILKISLWVYVAHLGFFSMISSYIHESDYSALFDLFFKSFLLGGSIGFMVAWIYMAYGRCREEYACDVQGIESIPVLQGGANWLLHDAKAYVDGLFSGPLRFLRFLYRAFPNALCSLFTLHPHPIARAAAIEKKIVQLQ
jgi:hypothetical protein